MKWVTRSFPHVDRTASAWLIKRFIDPKAEFIFIDWPDELIPEDAIPFDIKGVEHGHHDNKCTFETIVEKYNITDPIVHKIARLVHAMDFEDELEKVPEAKGIRMIISGLRFAVKKDMDALEIGFKIWDALYSYFKSNEILEKYSENILSKMSRLEKYRFIRERVRKTLAFY
ncbi:MAG: chromate resistance protein [Thermoprotei archaeon]|nr:MAG: chromate resistance protein [Thermoprotei archaeon]